MINHEQSKLTKGQLSQAKNSEEWWKGFIWFSSEITQIPYGNGVG